MKAQASLFDRDLDASVNAAKAADLHAYGVPCYWIAISPVEAQALTDGVVSAAIREQAARLLRPGVGEKEQWFG